MTGWPTRSHPKKKPLTSFSDGSIRVPSCCCITPPKPMARFWMRCLQNGRRWGIHFLHSKSLSGTLENKNKPVCFHQFLSDFCKPVHSIHPILIEINHIHFECIIHLRMTSSLFRKITQKICCRIKQIVIIITCSEQIIIIIF